MLKIQFREESRTLSDISTMRIMKKNNQIPRNKRFLKHLPNCQQQYIKTVTLQISTFSPIFQIFYNMTITSFIMEKSSFLLSSETLECFGFGPHGFCVFRCLPVTSHSSFILLSNCLQVSVLFWPVSMTVSTPYLVSFMQREREKEHRDPLGPALSVCI